jgi:hypothetical protein
MKSEIPAGQAAKPRFHSGNTQEKRGRMKLKILVLCIMGIVPAWTASADTLRLKNGHVIYGQFVGRSSEGVQFAWEDGTVVTYPPQEVAGLSFGPIPAPHPRPEVKRMTVPAGTIVLIQMVDTLDTSYTETGQVFSATLSTNLLADGYVVAKMGSPVYGLVVEANSAGRATGSSQLQLQLTQVVIGGDPFPIVTNIFDSKGKSSGRRSARRLFGGAGLGAAIGAIAGNAGMGAAIGAVAGGIGAVAQKGDQVQIPSETQLQFILQQPVTLPVVR